MKSLIVMTLAALIAVPLFAGQPVKKDIEIVNGAGFFEYEPDSSPSYPSFVLDHLVLPGAAATTTIYTITQEIGLLTNLVGTKIIAANDRRLNTGTNVIRLFRGDGLRFSAPTNISGTAHAVGREE